MPRIPRVFENVDPQYGRANESLDAAAAPGNALAHVGGVVTEIGQQMLDQQVELARTRSSMAATSKAEDAAGTFYNQTVKDPTIDPDSLADAVKQGMQTVHDEVAKEIKDPLVKIKFDQDFLGIADRHVTNARNVGFRRSIDNWAAQANTSIETYVNASATAPENEVDYNKSKITGILQGEVAHGALTKVQAQEEEQKISGRIDHAQALHAMQSDPGTTADLLRANKWPHIDPVKREELIKQADAQAIQKQKQVLIDQKNAAEAAAKQRKQDMDLATSNYETDLTLQNNGQAPLNAPATLQRLVAIQQQFADGKGEPLPYTVFERLYDNTVKPPQQIFDPATYSAMKIAVNSTNPPSAQMLSMLYNGGHGPLNLEKYTELEVDRLKNLATLKDKNRVIQNEQRSQNEKVINDEFGGDKSIHAAALKDLLNGSSLHDIETKYQAAYKTTSDFKRAQTSYETALKQFTSWKQTYFGMHVSDNPALQDSLERKTQELILAAKKAKKDLGPAPHGWPEGKVSVGADGTPFIVVGGRAIGQ